ncbi:hypothetical protein B0T22DRAFT_171906 [Podospora appendiculata]|uniref:Uncharacterized protein n=1 Tax=Podospora appendiculata TaxID=314037 RepID=A0AAE1CDE8_9PEZI|nr:hypothetical protein B0T22DRAFT_171906 [Podospora appendiculata]
MPFLFEPQQRTPRTHARARTQPKWGINSIFRFIPSRPRETHTKVPTMPKKEKEKGRNGVTPSRYSGCHRRSRMGSPTSLAPVPLFGVGRGRAGPQSLQSSQRDPPDPESGRWDGRPAKHSVGARKSNRLFLFWPQVPSREEARDWFGLDFLSKQIWKEIAWGLLSFFSLAGPEARIWGGVSGNYAAASRRYRARLVWSVLCSASQNPVEEFVGGLCLGQGAPDPSCLDSGADGILYHLPPLGVTPFSMQERSGCWHGDCGISEPSGPKGCVACRFAWPRADIGSVSSRIQYPYSGLLDSPAPPMRSLGRQQTTLGVSPSFVS